MNGNDIVVECPPSEKASIEDLKRQSDYFLNFGEPFNLMDYMLEMVLVLNDKRQIVYSNQIMLDILGIENKNKLIGLRPGDALSCMHADKCLGGCGMTPFCTKCGALQAILLSQKGQICSNECRIVRKKGEEQTSIDLKVKTKPFQFNGENFLLFTGIDISHEKRRKVLERVFFHDILNLAGGLKGYISLISGYDFPKEKVSKYHKNIDLIADEIIGEIESQKDLLNAENNELYVNIVPITSVMLLKQIKDIYSRNPVSLEKKIVIDSKSEAIVFFSDKKLIQRVLGNLIKNALEAINSGDAVTIGCKSHDNEIEFFVHNNGCMAQSVQLQIFKRSFSTKGTGRGLGTYSVKLFTEEYLKGKVDYKTSKDAGTVFMVRYPINLQI
ncbi:MAG: HAMP domain-containing histidine kinase [Desulfobacterales bacterium]|nr:HAMP domain-containing histidine kinase [Desulfobacterales bacterium]